MLGQKEEKVNARRANEITRRKVQFMVKEEAVADDFLTLVDKLRHIKHKNSRTELKNLKEQQELEKEQLAARMVESQYLYIRDEANNLHEQNIITKADVEEIKRVRAAERRKEIDE